MANAPKNAPATNIDVAPPIVDGDGVGCCCRRNNDVLLLTMTCWNEVVNAGSKKKLNTKQPVIRNWNSGFTIAAKPQKQH